MVQYTIMRYIKNLTQETIKELEDIIKNDSRYRSRNRAQAILLSNQGKTTNELVNIFGVSQRTVYRWFNRFSQITISALHDLEGRGRKATLNGKEDEKIVKEVIKKN